MKKIISEIFLSLLVNKKAEVVVPKLNFDVSIPGADHLIRMDITAENVVIKIDEDKGIARRY